MARILVTSDIFSGVVPPNAPIFKRDPNRGLTNFLNLLSTADRVAQSPAAGAIAGLAKRGIQEAGVALEEADIEAEQEAAKAKRAEEVAGIRKQAAEKIAAPLPGQEALSALEKEQPTLEAEAKVKGKTKEDIIAESIEAQGKVEDAIVALRNRKRTRGLSASEQGVLDRLVGAVGGPAGSLEMLKAKEQEQAAIPKEVEMLESKAAELEKAPLPEARKRTRFTAAELESMAMRARTPEERQRVLESIDFAAPTTTLYGALTGQDEQKFRSRLIGLMPKEQVAKPLSALDLARIQKTMAETEKLRMISEQIPVDAEEKRRLLKAKTRDLTAKNDAMYRGFDFWKASIFQKLKRSAGGKGRSPDAVFKQAEQMRKDDLRRVEDQHDEAIKPLESSRQKLEDARNRFVVPDEPERPNARDYTTKKDYQKAEKDYLDTKSKINRLKEEKDKIDSNIKRLDQEISTRKNDREKDRQDVEKAYDEVITRGRSRIGAPKPVAPKRTKAKAEDFLPPE